MDPETRERDFEAEVERRLRRLEAEPELLARYDVSSDGELDDAEWSVVERLIRCEVKTERSLQTDRHTRSIEPEIIVERFELVGMLGRGGQGLTYLARDLEQDSHVVVKELLLSEIEDWKAIDLFEREAEVLRSLSHSRIPGYIDAFHIDADGRTRFFLVQDYVEGDSLEAMLEDGELFDEESIEKLFESMHGVLEYIHGRRPPVVHRDIKPSNIIQGRDGGFYLIDFGAVQAVLPETVGGSTIVGTAGYVPFEQFRGRAEPRSDIFAFAATVAHLMSGIHPSQFDQNGPRVELPTSLDASTALRTWLEKALSPMPEDRPSDLGLAFEGDQETGAIQRRDNTELVPERPPLVPDVSVYRDGRGRTITQMKSGEEVLIELIDWEPDYVARVAHRHSKARALESLLVMLGASILAVFLFTVSMPIIGVTVVVVGVGVFALLSRVEYHTVTMSPYELLVNDREISPREVLRFKAVGAYGDHHDAGVDLYLADETVVIGRSLRSAHARYLADELNRQLKRIQKKPKSRR